MSTSSQLNFIQKNPQRDGIWESGASFRSVSCFCLNLVTAHGTLGHNPQRVLPSHLRNKTRCFDTVFTRSVFGLSKNGMKASGFRLQSALLKLLQVFLLMCTAGCAMHTMGTASALKLPGSSDCTRTWHLRRSLPFPSVKLITLQAAFSGLLGNEQIICLSKNIKMLASPLSHILNSVSYCNRRFESHLCNSSACHWWQVLGNGLYPHSPFVNKIPRWEGKPKPKDFF